MVLLLMIEGFSWGRCLGEIESMAINTYLEMGGIENNQWFGYIATTLIGQEMELEVVSGCTPHYLVPPHHPVPFQWALGAGEMQQVTFTTNHKQLVVSRMFFSLLL